MHLARLDFERNAIERGYTRECLDNPDQAQNRRRVHRRQTSWPLFCLPESLQLLRSEYD